MDGPAMLKAVDKAFRVCESVLLYVAVLATFLLMILTTFDAASRYLLNHPITGAYEISEKYLIVAAIFLGLSYAYRGGVFVRVTFLVDQLPATAKLLCNYVAQILSLSYCVILVWTSGRAAIRNLADDTTLSTLPLLVGPAYLLVPIGFLFMALLMLVDVGRVRTERSYLFRDDVSTT